jgi:hypothetical protein
MAATPPKTDSEPQRGRGRPRLREVTARPSWSTDPERLAALEAWATERGLTRSEAIDAAVDLLLERRRTKRRRP